MTAERNNITTENPREEFGETDRLQDNNEENDEETKRTCKETCLYVMKNITVEPSTFLFILGIIISVLTSQNLSIEKACRVNLNFTTEICDALRAQTLGDQNAYERAVQRLVAQAMAWKTYITASIPCMLALFIGSFSDKTGYRIFFLCYAVTGQCLVCVNGIINTYFLKQTNLEIFVISEALIDGLSGSWCIIFLTSYSFISAITTDTDRTFRMGLLSFSITVGFPIGMGVSGILLKTIGFYGCYGLSGGLHFMNLLYTIFFVKDPKRTPEHKLVSVENT
ncbi:proton-coupled folate transporter-like [Maniola hyperantus]|uniref:proton-coupled folate transporter-like n=1 Tax=Aphantopus hyperantus TaxID=2795564 RepID=UPI00374A12DD